MEIIALTFLTLISVLATTCSAQEAMQVADYEYEIEDFGLEKENRTEEEIDLDELDRFFFPKPWRPLPNLPTRPSPTTPVDVVRPCNSTLFGPCICMGTTTTGTTCTATEVCAMRASTSPFCYTPCGADPFPMDDGICLCELARCGVCGTGTTQCDFGFRCSVGMPGGSSTCRMPV